MSKYHKFVRPAPPFESAPEPRVVSGGGRGARLRGGSSLQVMGDAIERAQQGKGRKAQRGGSKQRGRGLPPGFEKRTEQFGRGSRRLKGGNEVVIQRKHVGFGNKSRGVLKGGSKLLLKGGRAKRERGSMMRGGSMESGGAPPLSVADGSTPSTAADIGDSGGGALGVGENMMQMQRINPRPQQYGGVNVAPMRLMVDRIPVIGQ